MGGWRSAYIVASHYLYRYQKTIHNAFLDRDFEEQTP
jgi:hypothetical protein